MLIFRRDVAWQMLRSTLFHIAKKCFVKHIQYKMKLKKKTICRKNLIEFYKAQNEKNLIQKTRVRI